MHIHNYEYSHKIFTKMYANEFSFTSFCYAFKIYSLQASMNFAYLYADLGECRCLWA